MSAGRNFAVFSRTGLENVGFAVENRVAVRARRLGFERVEDRKSAGFDLVRERALILSRRRAVFDAFEFDVDFLLDFFERFARTRRRRT
jgi:hypothetical protein